MASWHPYYRKWLPSAKNEKDFTGNGQLIDLKTAHLEETAGDRVPAARASFDDRAAAAIRAAAAVDDDATDDTRPPRIWPAILWRLKLPAQLPLEFFPDKDSWFKGKDLLELKWYDGQAPTIHIPTSKCLALLSYLDYFPNNRRVGLGLRSMVSRAVLSASPGWCGSFGPGVDGAFSLTGEEGNYDMSLMHLVPMAYRHYDDLSPAARELLITQLLARGRAHRPRVDDTFTSGRNPVDWSRAGFISPGGYHVDIGETENHVLMIVTARYLTNQLLYQQNGGTEHDNRRNGDEHRWSCFSLLLYLLRNMLRGDFSEYNAKGYQSETRWALLNLCTYAYDHEVRLGARMVLDYRAAHIATSSNDLRRLVPFRRRFEDKNAQRTADGFMMGGLLTEAGGDPMAPYFAMQAGNIRSYEGGSPTTFEPFSIGDAEVAADVIVEVLSDYRIPPSIHDLFVNDQSRRFFQRLHRTRRNEVGGNRNCDNMEIYAGSPSYLITAGGAPATWALDPGKYAEIDGEKVCQELGVAVTTSFIPTGFNIQGAGNLIQFGSFSKKTTHWTRLKVPFFDAVEANSVVLDSVENYGVAPDFACGHQVFLPDWLNENNTEGVPDGVMQDPRKSSGFSFVHKGSSGGPKEYSPGYYLAIYQEAPGGFALMEALDTWINPHVGFYDFKHSVLQKNGGMHIRSNVATHYTTYYNNGIDFLVWSNSDGHSSISGATVTAVGYRGQNSAQDSADSLGNADQITGRLLNGTILNSPQEGKVEIANPTLGTLVTLDFTDPAHPRRTDSQTGEFEVAGFNNEVWLDFEYHGEPLAMFAAHSIRLAEQVPQWLIEVLSGLFPVLRRNAA